MPKRCLALAMISLAFVSPIEARPLLHYVFDRSGTQNDLGAAPAANATLTNRATMVYSSPNGFSCGALDLTGAGAGHNYAAPAGDVAKLDALPAMTLTLWVNLRSDPTDQDCLAGDMAPWNAPAGQGGWELRIVEHNGVQPTAASFRVAFMVEETKGGFSNTMYQVSEPVNAAGRWAFVAVTYAYDPTWSAYRERYYFGSETEAVSHPGIDGLLSIPLLDNAVAFRVGSASSEPSTDRTPPAWIDDVRIYDRALSQAEIEQVRRENIMDVHLGVTPAFFGIGSLPGTPCASWAVAVSGDGSTIVGQALTSPIVRPFRWKDGVIEAPANPPPEWTRGTAMEVSDDGSVVVGYGAASSLISDWRAFRWEGDELIVLDALPGGDDSGFAYSVSGDGSVVVGTSSGHVGPNEGFRWEGGVTSLMAMPEGSQTLPMDVSRDGRVIVGIFALGFNDTRAFRWEDGVLNELGPVPQALAFDSRVRISANQAAIVGWAQPGTAKEGVIWRAGRVFGLGDLPGGPSLSEATAVSANGSYVVGVGKIAGSSAAGESAAFIWDRVHGIRNLKEVLASDYGLDVEGWKLVWATAISDDGSVITGYGSNPAGIPAAPWVARLPVPPAAMDLDRDGDVDSRDAELFASCATGPDVPYAGAVPPGCSPGLDVLGVLPADLDWDGDVDQADFSALQLCINGPSVPPPVECRG